MAAKLTWIGERLYLGADDSGWVLGALKKEGGSGG
jgi:hypothetical protein